MAEASLEEREARGELLAMWTIYESPLDAPGQFVAHKFLILPGELEPHRTGEKRVALTLEDVRAMLPPGLYRMPRSEGDEPQIVETWF